MLRRVYDGTIFPAALGLIFPYFLALASMSTRVVRASSALPVQLASFLSLLFMLFTSLVLSNEFKHLLVQVRKGD